MVIAMGRFVVIRDDEQGGERLVEETIVPTEAALHEVLMRHPALVPAADLGFGRVATVGFETTLASGSADLVLLDDAGRVCIVEVKKEGNPDTRRVIAQLLDYAAALWGLGVEDFERHVVQRRSGVTDHRMLREFIVEELVADADDPEDAADRTLAGLAESLRTGDFALVLAAPTIPVGVQRVIEYLNARGHSIFGLEVSYFQGDVEAFVPRLVVRPSLATRIAGGTATRAAQPIDAETLIASLPEDAQDGTREFIREVRQIGGELDWKENRVRVRVRGESGPKVLVTVQPEVIWFTHGVLKGLDPTPGTRVAAQLSTTDGVSVGSHYASLKLADASDVQVRAALGIASAYVEELVASVGSGD